MGRGAEIWLSASEPWALRGAQTSQEVLPAARKSQTPAEYLGILGMKMGHLSTPQSVCLSFTPWPLTSLSPALHGAPLCREARSKGSGPAGVQEAEPGGASDLGCSLETSGVLFLSQRSTIRGENCNSKRSHFSLSDFRTFNLSLSLCRARVL